MYRTCKALLLVMALATLLDLCAFGLPLAPQKRRAQRQATPLPQSTPTASPIPKLPDTKNNSTKDFDSITISTEVISEHLSLTSAETKPLRLWVKLDNTTIDALWLYISFSAEFTGPSVGTKPNSVNVYIRNASERDYTFAAESDRLLWFTVDGERVPLNYMERYDMMGHNGLRELLECPMSYEGFMRLVKGEQITGRLGPLDFELTEGHKRALRNLAKSFGSADKK